MSRDDEVPRSRRLPTGAGISGQTHLIRHKNAPDRVAGAVHSGRGELVGPAGIGLWRGTLVAGPKAFDCGRWLVLWLPDAVSPYPPLGCCSKLAQPKPKA